jgi:hypothetical protein
MIGYNKNLEEIAYEKVRSYLVANMTLNARSAITTSMDWRSIALYLSMKKLSAKTMYKDLVQTLDAEAVAYSTVAQEVFLHEQVEDETGDEISPDDELDEMPAAIG